MTLSLAYLFKTGTKWGECIQKLLTIFSNYAGDGINTVTLRLLSM